LETTFQDLADGRTAGSQFLRAGQCLLFACGYVIVYEVQDDAALLTLIDGATDPIKDLL